MSSIFLPITPPTLPQGYCWPDSPQQFANDAVGGAVVNFDVTGATLVLKQPSQPLNTQRNSLWYNTSTGHTLYYENAVAAWVQLIPSEAGGLDRRIFMGDATALDSYDGGSSGVVGAVAGPVWQIDAVFAGRLPLGVGNLPDVVNGIVAILLGATGGHNELPIIKDNLPASSLYVQTAVIGQSGVTGTGSESIVGTTYGSDAISGAGGACDATSSALSGRYYTRGQTEPMGLATALNSINPYVGVNVIKRTNRLYYAS